MNLERLIEGVLFYEAEPVKKAELARLLHVGEERIETGIEALRNALKERGLALVETDTDVQLVTAPELSPLLEEIRKDDMRRDIGKAGAETLAIVLYKGPLTRAEIDFVRGVNSTFILRNLLIRGLVERVPNPHDQRSFHYKVTPMLLAHLGISKKTDLPNYDTIMNELDTYEKEFQRTESEEAATHEHG